MLEAVFWIAIGAFVGWNFPQPHWAKKVQQSITEYVIKMFK